MKRLLCRAIRTTLAARVLDVGHPPFALEGHVSHCLRCQAVVAQSRRLRRTLTSVNVEPAIAPMDDERASMGWMAAGVASVVAASVLAARLRAERS